MNAQKNETTYPGTLLFRQGRGFRKPLCNSYSRSTDKTQACTDSSSLSACVLYLLTPHVINTMNQKQMWFAPHSSKKKQTPNTAFVSCSWNKAQDPGNCSISTSWPLVYLVSVICTRSGEGAYFEAWQNTWLPVGNTSSLTKRKPNTGEVLTQRVNIILGH